MSNDQSSKSKIHQSQIQKYNIHLSSSQLNYLNSLLPKNYSFQLQTKLTNKTNKAKAINQLSRTQGESQSRVRKVTSIYNQQSQPLVIPKSISSKKTSVSQYINQQLKHCSKILNSLKNSKYSWPFRQPVDPVEMGVPQYYQIVTEPMDLQTVQKNLQQNLYTTATQFHADINKIIRNSYTFNKHNQQFTKLTAQFERYYIKIISAPIKNNSTLSETNRDGQRRINAQTNKKKKKSITLQSKDLGELLAPTLTEKKELSQQIRRLNKDDLRGVVQIVYAGNSEIQQTFDIEDLPTNKVRQLQRYVKEKISLQDQLGKSNKKSEIVHANSLPNNQQSSFMVDSDS